MPEAFLSLACQRLITDIIPTTRHFGFLAIQQGVGLLAFVQSQIGEQAVLTRVDAVARGVAAAGASLLADLFTRASQWAVAVWLQVVDADAVGNVASGAIGHDQLDARGVAQFQPHRAADAVAQAVAGQHANVMHGGLAGGFALLALKRDHTSTPFLAMTAPPYLTTSVELWNGEHRVGLHLESWRLGAGQQWQQSKSQKFHAGSMLNEPEVQPSQKERMHCGLS